MWLASTECKVQNFAATKKKEISISRWEQLNRGVWFHRNVGLIVIRTLVEND